MVANQDSVEDNGLITFNLAWVRREPQAIADITLPSKVALEIAHLYRSWSADICYLLRPARH